MATVAEWAVPFTSGRGRAQWATYLLVAVVVLDLVSIGSGFAQLRLLSRVTAGVAVTRSEALASDGAARIIALARFVATLATAVAFALWIYRAYRNLPALGTTSPDSTPNWAVGCFFVPIVNLVGPYQFVREIWNASEPDSTPQDEALFGGVPSQLRDTPSFIKAWWAMFLLSNVLANLAIGGMMGQRKTAVALLQFRKIAMVFVAANAVAAVLAILVVRRIDRRQAKRHRRMVEVGSMKQDHGT